jgi:formylglycine-generating enzyme required for sulfatase activity
MEVFGMFCIKCGKPVDEGANFCAVCGAKVEKFNTLPSSTPSAPTSLVASSKPIPVRLTASGLDGWSGEAHSLSEQQKLAVQPSSDSALPPSHRRFRWPWVLGGVVVVVGLLVVVPGGRGKSKVAGESANFSTTSSDIPLPNNPGIKFVRIPAGTFQMGQKFVYNPATDHAIHPVTISQTFYMATTVVTQGEWEAVMGSNPSQFKGKDLPVEKVSWDDAQVFISRMNEKDPGKGYRLPTEAEWEYSCRAGTTGERYGELDAIAWYNHNSGQTTHPVGQKQPNAWGLYDMLGNVWQWCQDRYQDDDYSRKRHLAYRVIRGGSWDDGARFVNPVICFHNEQDSHIDSIGFRLVKTLP